MVDDGLAFIVVAIKVFFGFVFGKAVDVGFGVFDAVDAFGAREGD